METKASKTQKLQQVEPEAPNFRSHLQAELLRRCRVNPSYSLRAFARFLDLEPSALSKILNGKRQLTATMYRRMVEKLDLSPVEIERLKPKSIRRGRNGEAQKISLDLPEYQNLTLDLFQVIADWYHYAILELTRIQGFKPDKKWIARKLGINVSLVNLAVERLIRLEMLQIDNQGPWKDVSGALTTTGNSFTSAAFRKLQKQILERAITVMEEVPIERRDQSSMTMAIDSHLLPEAKNKIKTFRRELCEFLQSSGLFDQVYQMGISLYPITKTGEEK